MTEPKDGAQGLKRLFDALADEEAAMPDAVVLDDAAREGLDVAAEGRRVRSVLLGAVLQAKKTRRLRAQEDHARAVAAIAQRSTKLPGDAAGRKALLSRVLGARPQMREAVVTLQHRDFESFSDEDIVSALRQLDALGLLDDETGSKP